MAFPLENERMFPEKRGHKQKEMSSPNPQVSGDMLVSRHFHHFFRCHFLPRQGDEKPFTSGEVTMSKICLTPQALPDELEMWPIGLVRYLNGWMPNTSRTFLKFFCYHMISKKWLSIDDLAAFSIFRRKRCCSNWNFISDASLTLARCAKASPVAGLSF